MFQSESCLATESVEIIGDDGTARPAVGKCDCVTTLHYGHHWDYTDQLITEVCWFQGLLIIACLDIHLGVYGEHARLWGVLIEILTCIESFTEVIKPLQSLRLCNASGSMVSPNDPFIMAILSRQKNSNYGIAILNKMGDKGEQYTSDSSVVSCAVITCVPLLITLMYARRNVLLNTTLNHIWQAFQGEIIVIFTF